jgi:hypothetical protein
MAGIEMISSNKDQHMKIKSIILGLAAAIMLGACSSADDSSRASFVSVAVTGRATSTTSADANKIDLALAISASLSKECVKARVPFTPFGGKGPFPVSLSFALPNDAAGKEQTKRWNQSVAAPFEALVKVGLLTEKDVLVENPLGGLGPGRKYSLTKAGRDALLNPQSTVFCAGGYKLSEVLQATKPMIVMGKTVSEARFTFAPIHVPLWASDDAVRTAFPGLVRGGEGQANLVQLGGHWEAELSLF